MIAEIITDALLALELEDYSGMMVKGWDGEYGGRAMRRSFFRSISTSPLDKDMRYI